MSESNGKSNFQEELQVLTEKIQSTMQEVAGIRHPMMHHDRVQSAVDELAAIVAATEVATDQILEAAEKLEGISEKINTEGRSDHAQELEITVTGIYEACNFQDITGQRISKVMTLLRDVDERLMSMIATLGAENFAQIEVPEDSPSGDAALLNGPALGNGMGQDSIDSLFD